MSSPLWFDIIGGIIMHNFTLSFQIPYHKMDLQKLVTSPPYFT